MTAPRIVLVVTGLRKEAAIAAGPGILAVAIGGSASGLDEIEPVSAGAGAVVSFGLAGALDPGLAPGALVCPEAVVGPDGARFPVSPELLRGWRGAGLAGVGPTTLLGVTAPVLDPSTKARLHRASGAVAIDMESHVAAAFASRTGLPFGAIRVISDGADRALPPVAGRAMRPDGSVDVLGTLSALARHPGQLPALIWTARDAGRAFRALGRVRRLLGPGLGLHL